ncbi:hypothetical protein [Dyella caseinilytica]|uniref:Uncharacterized protein n=1 Tax=Dyella caseinilytica TaxID=1849581 RepID=A0ABX7GPL5_9GAMM|nr:hypothetical protein [Dyella caseinilytica]QRN52337.1 hypothetical protein ISN74_12675 [Dyella caseinilytica]GGA14925.1 hypothetical protein GCM10011408_41070 [Dyella caseinilytica]
MRVQLEGQTLRLRVDEAELALLLAGGVAENRTHLPDGRVEVQQVRLAAQLDWRRDEANWHIGLPEPEVRALSMRLPSRDGLSFDIPTPGDAPLQLLFDVDVRDSARKRLHKPSEGDAS